MQQSSYRIGYSTNLETTYIHNRDEERDGKFSPTSRRGILVGFDEFNQNYLVFDYDNHKIVNTHNVSFDEKVFPERGDEIDDPFKIDLEPEEEKVEPTQDSDSKEETSSESKEEQVDHHIEPNTQPTISVGPLRYTTLRAHVALA
ncbi:hypothetical protein PGTUg99_030063 [Puccinia graminis f. sp. tritici]|uniref:Retroviral polymerase SH3-like domain-containing protein n=1 Tax=Puccinia graminis f. sp. tritici TaxID=56615 RepID=A0A5B0P1F2_PUCGR|nr:hypothetical protein PGTUg99_030063 [Puccinia graminis f. sp. tritici]